MFFMLQELDAVAGGDDVVMLKRAIANGDMETVKQLLDKGNNPNPNPVIFVYDNRAHLLLGGVFYGVISVGYMDVVID